MIPRNLGCPAYPRGSSLRAELASASPGETILPQLHQPDKDFGRHRHALKIPHTWLTAAKPTINPDEPNKCSRCYSQRKARSSTTPVNAVVLAVGGKQVQLLSDWCLTKLLKLPVQSERSQQRLDMLCRRGVIPLECVNCQKARFAIRIFRCRNLTNTRIRSC
ncbi:hypothetical protein Poly21_19010 [Allorhodopirellula heiligendammensis]|uniref:Uncharacterized protein n=1 Tax=Allorhodopirellula heiligendammensis TaxID=2714739 RepID=A0A5C6C8K9_9BACT|nr:hypothetical protein Poly21_19010 [Allorhodopirellula heiligendammensis]